MHPKIEWDDLPVRSEEHAATCRDEPESNS